METASFLTGKCVKMLARSSESSENEYRNIVESTAALVFLGTPHRGSPDLSAVGEWARSVLRILLVGSSAAILDTLGLKNADLERAQEAFSRLWRQYDFRVKTFQEGLGLTGVNLGVLGNKVVPDYSSLLGDQRERAETIQANHMDMCRFTGFDDPNYLKVAGELRSIHVSLVELNALRVHRDGLIQRKEPLPDAPPDAHAAQANKPTAVEEDCLRSLWFSAMHTRRQGLERPADQTCLWLFENATYRDWFSRRTRDEHRGLLWLKGKPGAGKSVLMKEAFHRASQELLGSDGDLTASFFFNARGDALERTPEGLFRSILFQLLSKNRQHLQEFIKTREEGDMGYAENSRNCWQASELQRFFSTIFARQPAGRTLIFVDGLDECDMKYVRSQAYFWREVTKSAHAAGVQLDVCLSSRHFPSITLDSCAMITVEDYNTPDITRYVEWKFKLGIATEEPQWGLLRDKVLGKSAGIFLWVVLVMEDVLKKWDEGKGLHSLLKLLDVVPAELETLFAQLFRDLDADARKITLRLFQWATLAVKPLRLHEWHHVLAFTREPAPRSLQEWRTSDHFTASDSQLERQIKSISKGLIEVKTIAGQHETQKFETISVLAEAGSLNLGDGGTRVVEVIRESVREFFLQSNGFSALDPDLGPEPIGSGHLSIMSTCLDYLDISELDALVQARHRAGNQVSHPHPTATLNLGSPSAPGGIPRRSKDEQRNSVKRGFSPSLSKEVAHQPRSSDTRRHPVRLSRAIGGQRHDTEYSSPGQHAHRFGEIIPPLAAAEVSSAEFLGYDIIRWLDLSTRAEHLSIYGSVCTTNTRNSFAGQSCILEDNPSLLFYAAFEFFSHAELADERCVNPSHIMRRLQDGKTWARLVALREDIPQGTQLSHYIAEWGPKAWWEHCRPGPVAIPEPHSSPAPRHVQLKKQPVGESSCEDSMSDQAHSPELRKQALQPRRKMFHVGLSSEEESSLKSALHSAHPGSLLNAQKKQAPFSNQLVKAARRKPQKAKGRFVLGGSGSESSHQKNRPISPRRKGKLVFPLGDGDCSESSLGVINRLDPGGAGLSSNPRDDVHPLQKDTPASFPPGAVFGLEMECERESEPSDVDESAIDDDDSSDWEDAVEDSHDEPVQPRRTRSIASFGSASSYVGVRRLQRQRSLQADGSAGCDWAPDDVLDRDEVMETRRQRRDRRQRNKILVDDVMEKRRQRDKRHRSKSLDETPASWPFFFGVGGISGSVSQQQGAAPQEHPSGDLILYSGYHAKGW